MQMEVDQSVPDDADHHIEQTDEGRVDHLVGDHAVSDPQTYSEHRDSRKIFDPHRRGSGRRSALDTLEGDGESLASAGKCFPTDETDGAGIRTRIGPLHD